MTERKEIAVDELSEAIEKGLGHIIDDIKVEGVITVRGKDGEIKRRMTINKLEVAKNAIRNNA